MKSLLLVDGSSLLTTNFYGTVPTEYMKAKTEEELEQARNKIMQVNGIYTNGVYGMMKALLKILDTQKPSHVVVAWDLNRNTFRREFYPEYKANRSDTKPELKSQFSLAQEVLREMGIAQFVLEGYEADDIIGTLCKKFETELPVHILTKDQDALQLVSDKTRLWYMTSKANDMYKELGVDMNDFNIPDNTFEFTPLYVEHFYGVTPLQIIDRKAIEGDTSDNIPGVKGVGAKSVIPLIQEFGSVEGIYDFIENHAELEIKILLKELGIVKSPLKKLLERSDTELVGKKAAEMSKKLATIHCDIEVLQNTTKDAFELRIDEVAQKRVFERLSFNSLLDANMKSA
jgi:DNA polymerase-1